MSSGTTKAALRQRARCARAARDEASRTQASAGLLDRCLLLPEVDQARLVGCYVSTPDEPATGPIVEALHARGVTVLLPLTRADNDLDWAAYQPGHWRQGRFGIREPSTPPQGADAITAADVVLCPGVAGDRAGHRLGRGGGSYDRALARVPPSTLRCLLLYADEVVDEVPVSDHDEPVDVLVTPGQTIRTRSAQQ